MTDNEKLIILGNGLDVRGGRLWSINPIYK